MKNLAPIFLLATGSAINTGVLVANVLSTTPDPKTAAVSAGVAVFAGIAAIAFRPR